MICLKVQIFTIKESILRRSRRNVVYRIHLLEYILLEAISAVRFVFCDLYYAYKYSVYIVCIYMLQGNNVYTFPYNSAILSTVDINFSCEMFKSFKYDIILKYSYMATND